MKYFFGLIRRPALFLVLPLLLAACGGGGGSTPEVLTVVASTSPSANAADVAVNTASITATFVSPMDPASINSATFNVNTYVGSVAGAVSYDAGSNTAVFRPSVNLAHGTTYIVTITRGAKTLAGKALDAPFSWSFTTGSTSDTTAPRVISVTPANGAVDVARGTTVTAAFSEPMDPATISNSFYDTFDFPSTFTLTGPAGKVRGALTYDVGSNTLAFRPSAPLTHGVYTATIMSGRKGVKDLAGNQTAADYSWSFTVDITPPVITSTNPARNAELVPANSSITATFSEGMDPATITTAVFTLTGPSGNVSGTVGYDAGSNSAIFRPAGNLSFGASYTATVLAGAKDLSGNQMAADYSWSFAVGVRADSTPPAVISMTPHDGETNVLRTSSITAVFSEPVDPATVNSSTFTLVRSDGGGVFTPVAGTVTYDAGSSTAVFRPSAILSYNRRYTATINSGVKDLAGKPIAANWSWTFTTFASPLTLDFAQRTEVGPRGDNAYALGIQPLDQKMVAAGNTWNGTDYDFAVVRYDSSGFPDPGFGTGGKVITKIGGRDDNAYALGIQADGKIVVAGNAWNGANYDFAVVRYNTDGSLDPGFGSGGKVITPVGSGNANAYALGIQADGRIVVAGNAWNGANYDFAVVRYNTDGTLDIGFGGTGKVSTPVLAGNDNAYALAIQADGKIVVAGDSFNGGDHDFAVVRYNTNGTLDPGFGGSGKITTAIGSSDDNARAVGIQADGRIVVAGHTWNGTDYDFAVARYNTNGTPDSAFNGTGKKTTAVGSGYDDAYALAIQPDGKIVVAGNSWNGTDYDLAAVRYNANGTVDVSTTTAVGGGDDSIRALALQSSDGQTKIAFAGFTWNGLNFDFLVGRYWP